MNTEQNHTSSEPLRHSSSGLPNGAIAITERESIELLLLRNRGLIDSPEMRLFDRSIVVDVFFEILSSGYLRDLDTIPAMQVYSRSFARFVFSAAGRVRFYHLERMLAMSPVGSPLGDSIARSTPTI